MTEMGEYLVGAYLKLALDCDFIIYNQRITSQREIDVIGIDAKKNTVYLCEVATHLGGLNYGVTNKNTIQKISEKLKAFHEYGIKNMPNIKKVCMFWSHNVPRGYLTNN